MSNIENLMNLSGRRALITGATGGLGKVMAETLAELGADLVIVDREDSDLKKFAKKLNANWGVKVESYVCDLEQQVQRSSLINWLKNGDQGLNIVLNNAAFVGVSDLSGWSVPFEDQTVETWRRALEVNVTAIFEICQGLTPILKVAQGASIINIASIYGMFAPDWAIYEDTGISNPAAYGVSKGGLLQFTRWLATTVSPNIRVNAISPGGIFRNQPKKFVLRYENKTPLGRMATEDDFRGAVAFLASDMSCYMTGQNLVVDGGWGIW